MEEKRPYVRFFEAGTEKFLAAIQASEALKARARAICDELMDIPKLNFQILRRTMATRAQNLGSVKDIRSHLRHSRANTTANEYMQELPESVQEMVGSVYKMLTAGAAEQQAT